MAEPFIGEIRLMSFTTVPRNWALCNGQLLPINQNAALFSLLGTTFGGDGRVNFALPDLRGRVPMHVGNGYDRGARGGELQHTLIPSEMPPHTHVLNGTYENATMTDPTNNVLGTTVDPSYQGIYASGMNAGSVGIAGSGHNHENTQPTLVISFCIALAGVFPSRS